MTLHTSQAAVPSAARPAAGRHCSSSSGLTSTACHKWILCFFFSACILLSVLGTQQMVGRPQCRANTNCHSVCLPTSSAAPAWAQLRANSPEAHHKLTRPVGCCCVRSSSSPWGFHATVLSSTSAFSSSRVYLCLQSLNLLNKKLWGQFSAAKLSPKASFLLTFSM